MNLVAATTSLSEWLVIIVAALVFVGGSTLVGKLRVARAKTKAHAPAGSTDPDAILWSTFCAFNDADLEAQSGRFPELKSSKQSPSLSRLNDFASELSGVGGAVSTGKLELSQNSLAWRAGGFTNSGGHSGRLCIAWSDIDHVTLAPASQNILFDRSGPKYAVEITFTNTQVLRGIFGDLTTTGADMAQMLETIRPGICH